MTCPDCNPEAFRRALATRYGEPTVVGGCAFYGDGEMPRDVVLDPADWSRAQCPIHAPAQRQGDPK